MYLEYTANRTRLQVFFCDWKGVKNSIFSENFGKNGDLKQVFEEIFAWST